MCEVYRPLWSSTNCDKLSGPCIPRAHARGEASPFESTDETGLLRSKRKSSVNPLLVLRFRRWNCGTFSLCQTKGLVAL